VARIIDMGVEPFLLSSSLLGVVAQRLVRKICPECGQSCQAEERDKRILGCDLESPLSIKKGAGCDYCNMSGYKGRIGVFEIMEVDKEIRMLIDGRCPTDQLRDAALKNGMVSLWEDALRKVLNGVTTMEEMLRVTYTN